MAAQQAIQEIDEPTKSKLSFFEAIKNAEALTHKAGVQWVVGNSWGCEVTDETPFDRVSFALYPNGKIMLMTPVTDLLSLLSIQHHEGINFSKYEELQQAYDRINDLEQRNVAITNLLSSIGQELSSAREKLLDKVIHQIDEGLAEDCDS